MKIVLIGFMGSGKTSVAKALQEKLSLPKIDMDDIVYQKTACKNMRDVFDKGGEILLRETEIEIAREYRQAKDLIIATGGGVVMNKIIIDYLKENDGKIFYLDVSLESIFNRIKHNKARPLFQDLAQVGALYEFRRALYQKYADEVISAEHKSVFDISCEIVNKIENLR